MPIYCYINYKHVLILGCSLKANPNHMGNATNSEYTLQKGEGFRIVKVQEKSPFLGKVEEFFDFIIQVIPPESQKSPTQILDKLAGPPGPSVIKSPLQMLKENAGKVIKTKIVSTKYRKVRTIQVDLSQELPEGSDLAGLSVRKERFDEVFDTYFPITDIKPNSPVNKAGIREGQFLIGCLEYPYKTIQHFMEGLYERYFDKEVESKSVHLVLYDIAADNLTVKQVILKRGWGGKGLLGCQFLQGMLNKFPQNLEQHRRNLRTKEVEMREVQQLRNQLGDCDGSSKSLMESLQTQRKRRRTHLREIKHLLNVEPPRFPSMPQQAEEASSIQNEGRIERSSSSAEGQVKRIDELQQRVRSLEYTLSSVKEYLNKLQIDESSEIERQ